MFAPFARIRRPEIMDAPDLDRSEHEYALRSLNMVNRWLGVDRSLSHAIEQIGPLSTMSVADIGAGGGGFLQYISKRRGNNAGPTLLALDRSWFAMDRTRRWSRGQVNTIVMDALSIPLADSSVDVVTCSLFLHHFDEPQVTAILGEAKRVARKGVIVSDLVRSRLAWLLTWATTCLVSRSRIFRSDGIRSVRAAYRPDELVGLAKRAGLRDAPVKHQFPFRMLLIYRKMGNGCEQV